MQVAQAESTGKVLKWNSNLPCAAIERAKMLALAVKPFIVGERRQICAEANPCAVKVAMRTKQNSGFACS